MKYSICTKNGVYFLIIDRYPVGINKDKIFYDSFKELVDSVCKGDEYSLVKIKETGFFDSYTTNHECLLDLNSFCEFKRVRRTHPEWFL